MILYIFYIFFKFKEKNISLFMCKQTGQIHTRIYYEFLVYNSLEEILNIVRFFKNFNRNTA